MKKLFKKIAAVVGFGKLDKNELLQVEVASTNALLMTMVELQIETTWGLNHRKVAFMFKEQAQGLAVKAGGESVGIKEKAVLLGMSERMLTVANDLEFKATKADSKK